MSEKRRRGFWGTLECLVRLPFRLAISVVMVFASIGVLIASIALDDTPGAIESIGWMFHRIWYTSNGKAETSKRSEV